MHACGREAKRTLSETSGRYKTVREHVAIGLDESASFLLVWLRIQLMDGPRGRNIVGMRIGPLILHLSISTLEFAHCTLQRFASDLPIKIAADKKIQDRHFFVLSNIHLSACANIFYFLLVFNSALIHSY